MGVDCSLLRAVVESGVAAPGTGPALRDQACATECIVDGVVFYAVLGFEQSLHTRPKFLAALRDDREPCPAEKRLCLVGGELSRGDEAFDCCDLEHAEQTLVLRFDVRARTHPHLILEQRECGINALVGPLCSQILALHCPVPLPTPSSCVHLRTLLHMGAAALLCWRYSGRAAVIMVRVDHGHCLRVAHSISPSSCMSSCLPPLPACCKLGGFVPALLLIDVFPLSLADLMFLTVG
mmetsp:Transcript_43751/g.102962  ORF Transcript_43751/g.102962 Transcript_43751/m.102962 type:complete len:237 (+) Transcript_43751:791-1501(+)